jgi:hypothetical protein
MSRCTRGTERKGTEKVEMRLKRLTAHKKEGRGFLTALGYYRSNMAGMSLSDLHLSFLLR